MPDITAIMQAFGALKALKDIGEATIGLANAAAFRERQIEFQQQIIDAQSAISTMQAEHSAALERVSDLEKELARLKAWKKEKKRYELKDLGTGAFAHVIKPNAQGTEPFHCLCTNCYEAGNKSLMQNTGQMAPNHQGRIWGCYAPTCGNRINVRVWPPGYDPIAAVTSRA
jgi:hypothetical protein